MTIDPVSLAVTAALTAANMALTASQTFEGPRLTDTKATVADYGTTLNYLVGTRIVSCPAIFSKPIFEQRKKRKGKAGKQVSYSGFGTWAVHIADHEIESVLQIWFDNHLVYDATGGTEKLYPLADDYEFAAYVRFYTGSETQMPDPDMQAFVEARDGPDTCPAYRGTSYAYFEHIPLEQLGNRFPDVKMLVNAGGTQEWSPGATIRPAWDASAWNEVHFWNLSPNGRYALGGLTDKFAVQHFVVFDMIARTLIGPYDATAFTEACDNDVDYGNVQLFSIDDAGNIYGVGYDGVEQDHLVRAAAFGAGAVTTVASDPGNYIGYATWTFTLSTGETKVVSFSPTRPERSSPFAPSAFIFDPGDASFIAADAPTAFWPWMPLVDAWDDIWIVGAIQPGTSAYFWRIHDSGQRSGIGDLHIVTGLASADSGPAAVGNISAVAHLGGSGKYYLSWNNGQWLYLIDDDSFTVTASREMAEWLDDPVARWTNVPTDRSDIWIPGAPFVSAATDISFGWERISGTDLSTIGTVSIAGWGYTVPGTWSWPPTDQMLFSYAAHGFVGGRYLDGDSVDGPTMLAFAGPDTLETLLSLIVRRTGRDPGEFDFTAATMPIAGYNWTQGSGRQIAETICDLFDIDLRPHDFVVQALPRGSASLGTFDSGAFAAGSEGSPPFTLTDAAPGDLPRRLFLTYADLDAGQQPNVAMPLGPEPGAAETARELSFDMQTLALAPGDAQQLVDRYLRRLRFGRIGAEMGLTRADMAVEAGDVWTPVFDGEPMTMRCKKLTIGADGVLASEWERDDPAIARLSGVAGAPASGYVAPTIPDPVATLGVVLDLPLLVDAHEQTSPLAYIAAGPAEPGIWTGADFAMSDTGDLDSFAAGWDGIAPGDGTTFGDTVGALGEALPWLVDSGSVLTVAITAGELTAASLEDLLIDPVRNLAAIQSGDGWELVQFLTPTLVGERTYAISGFLRGVRGTEHRIAGHAPGDRFILLDSAKRHTLGASEIGDSDFYIATTTGAAVDQDAAFALAFTGASHRPYAAVNGLLALDTGSGDWSVTATRRTRIGGANLDGTDVPLGEVSEAWEADVMDGATVKRTLTGTSLPLIYSAADQTTDWGAPQTALTVNLYQMSPALSLRGVALNLAA